MKKQDIDLYCDRHELEVLEITAKWITFQDLETGEVFDLPSSRFIF